MGSDGSLFNLSPSQSADLLISHLADFLAAFPLYAQGERAGEMAGDAGAMMLVHAAVLRGDAIDDLLTSHLFLAGTSLLAFSNPRLFANTSSAPDGAQRIRQWLNEFASGIEASDALPHEDPILSAPDTSFDFLDCTAYGALHKSLEAIQDHSLTNAAAAKVQTDLAVVLLEVAIGYDLHMGHLDHALASWGSMAMLSTIDIALPPGVLVPYQYRRLLVSYLRSLADNYALTKDFAFLFTS